jgi:diaminopimelate decarboxylase
MTLAELVPSLGGSAGGGLADGVWPAGTRLTDRGELVLGGVPATRLAAMFGTPAYVLVEPDVRERCRAYRAALPGVEISYASKALLTRAVARWVTEEGLGLDVCSAGELAVARRAGVGPERITLHGNAKTVDELKAVAAGHAGRVVIDSLAEIDQLSAVAPAGQRVLVRVTPGVDAHTHAAIATGVEDQKFGVSLADGTAAHAVRRVLAEPSLTLTGVHCHLGSQITRVAAFEEAVRRMVGFLAAIRDDHGVVLPLLNLGGGHAVRYRPGDTAFDLATFARRLHITVILAAERHRLPVPTLGVEPGRAIVGRAGVTLYRVVTVKRVPSGRVFVVVDGGMSDNPRPALYGAAYTAHLVGRPSSAPLREVTVAGRHCEAGDLIAAGVRLPADTHPGDLLAVPVTGAYHHALASTYNQVCRPPVVAVADGTPRLLVRRETTEDLLARDIGG